MDDSHHTRRDRGSSESAGPPAGIPDHELIRRIGEGSYGEVWLARSVVGSYHAIKIVYRRSFEDDTPYEREFRGIIRFEPVSRSHSGLVNVLHVGRNDQAGYFYYVMELADHAGGGSMEGGGAGLGGEGPAAGAAYEPVPWTPDQYDPKTLGRLLSQGGPLPLEQCVQLGLALASALQHLHGQGLIHRDIKPSNIIFVRGQPKIADIGLVAQLGSSKSFVGTEGYIPPEGPGTVQADLFSLGKVLYETSTGLDRRRFPLLPDSWLDARTQGRWLELNEIMLKACDEDRKGRYHDAGEMHSELEFLQVGKSVRRLRALEKRVALLTRLGIAAGLAFFLGAAAYYQVLRAQHLTARRLAEAYMAHGTRSVNETDLFGSLPWFAEALHLSQSDPDRAGRCRIHLASVLRQCPKLSKIWFHSHEAQCAEFSPDGTRIVSGSSDGTIKVWVVEQNREELSFNGHAAEVITASYSPDGAHIATSSWDGTAKIWESSTGRCVQTLTLGQQVFAACFHPINPELLLTASGNTAHLWHWRTNGLAATFADGHTQAILSARFSPKGDRIVTAGRDTLALVWDVAARRPVGKPMAHGEDCWVYDAAFSPDGTLVATGAFENFAALWDAGTGQRIWTWDHEAAVSGVGFSPDGRYLATACWDFNTRIWDLRTHRQAGPALPEQSQTHTLAFDRTGRTLVTATTGGLVSLWDLSPNHWRPAAVTSVYSPDGTRFITRTNQQVRIWDALTLEAVTDPAAVESKVWRVHCNRDASRFILLTPSPAPSGAASLQARLWAVDQGRLTPDSPPFICGTVESGLKSCMSEDGKWLAAFRMTGTGAVWHVPTGKLAREFPTANRIDSPAFDPTGKFLAFCQGKQIELWDTTWTNAPRRLVHESDVRHLAFSASGRHLVSSCRDTSFAYRPAQVWDVQTGAKIGPPLLHRDGVWSASFNPQCDLVASASEDNSAQIWRFREGVKTGPPLPHKFQVRQVSFSQDGRWVATASGDSTARVWDSATSEPVTPPLRHESKVWKAQIVSGGQALLTQDQYMESWLWDLTPEPKPAQDLRDLSQLLSHHTIDPIAGAIRLDKERMRSLWLSLAGRYATNFSVTLEERINWHAIEAAQCEWQKLWPALRFHLDRLLELRPNDPALIERRDRIPTN